MKRQADNKTAQSITQTYKMEGKSQDKETTTHHEEDTESLFLFCLERRHFLNLAPQLVESGPLGSGEIVFKKNTDSTEIFETCNRELMPILWCRNPNDVTARLCSEWYVVYSTNLTLVAIKASW